MSGDCPKYVQLLLLRVKPFFRPEGPDQIRSAPANISEGGLETRASLDASLARGRRGSFPLLGGLGGGSDCLVGHCR